MPRQRPPPLLQVIGTEASLASFVTLSKDASPFSFASLANHGHIQIYSGSSEPIVWEPHSNQSRIAPLHQTTLQTHGMQTKVRKLTDLLLLLLVNVFSPHLCIQSAFPLAYRCYFLTIWSCHNRLRHRQAPLVWQSIPRPSVLDVVKLCFASQPKWPISGSSVLAQEPAIHRF